MDGGSEIGKPSFLIPGHIDNGNVHRMLFEIRLKLTYAIQRFAGGDWYVPMVAYVSKCIRIEHVEFGPEQIEWFQGANLATFILC